MKSLGGILIGGVVALAGVAIIVSSFNKADMDYLFGFGDDDDSEGTLIPGAENCADEEKEISETAKEALASL